MQHFLEHLKDRKIKTNSCHNRKWLMGTISRKMHEKICLQEMKDINIVENVITIKSTMKEVNESD